AGELLFQTNITEQADCGLELGHFERAKLPDGAPFLPTYAAVESAFHGALCGSSRNVKFIRSRLQTLKRDRAAVRLRDRSLDPSRLDLVDVCLSTDRRGVLREDFISGGQRWSRGRSGLRARS